MTKAKYSKPLYFLFAFTCLWTSPVLANWQYTHWGMSPSEVSNASKGTVFLIPETPGDIIAGLDLSAGGIYKSGNYVFVAKFYFQQGHLALVNLSPRGGDVECLGVKHDLEGVYGAPYDTSNVGGVAQIVSWQDKVGNNLVELTIIGTDASSSCTLQYKPLVSESARGL